MTKQPNAIPLRPDYARAAAAAPNHVARAAFVAARANATGQGSEAVFRGLYPNDDISPVLLTTRAAAAPGSTTASGWASQLVQTAVANFLRALAPDSAAAALMARGMSLALGGRNSINVPLRSTAPQTPSWVTELAAIQVRSNVLDAVPLGPERKLGSIVVMSRTLLKRSDAAAVFGTLLREDASKGFDAAAFSDEDGLGDAHAGLLNGAAPGSGHAGGDVVARTADLEWLIDQVGPGGSGEVMFVTSVKRAMKLALRTDIKASFLPSLAVADDRVIAADPASIVWGAGLDPEIDVSSEGIVHMSDDPDAIVASGVTADPVRSLFQTDCVATRLLLPVAFAKRRAGAVAYIDGVTW